MFDYNDEEAQYSCYFFDMIALIGFDFSGVVLLMRCAIDTVYQLSTCGEGIRLIIESGKVLRCIITC